MGNNCPSAASAPLTNQAAVDIEDLYRRQLDSWPLAEANYAALENCRREEVEVYGIKLTVCFNPARIRSSAASVKPADVAARPCFLCRDKRPEEQLITPWGRYEILVNPFPVFGRHLTIAAVEHTPQAIAGRFADMVRLAGELPGMTVFYNGPRSGASAPDHQHFQAVPSDELPLWNVLDEGREWTLADVELLTGADADDVAARAEGLVWNHGHGKEPDMNAYARQLPTGEYQIAVIRRAAHRPSNYGFGEGQTLVSPASVEMAGVIVAPRPEDFDYCLDAANLQSIFGECAARPEPVAGMRTLDVGIVRADSLDVEFNGEFTDDRGRVVTGSRTITAADCPVKFTPRSADCSFTLRNVMIGIGFHWQQHEDQSFNGELIVYTDGDKLQAVNRVELETYLRSVVSSEMNALAPEEFLKAHAVISRSWVMAQVCPPEHLSNHDMTDTDGELIRWYDRDAHTGFDICADDHCQRYQGCTKASTPQVETALQATAGEVLAFDGQLCDARFSKCCGGVTELFSTCWQPVDLPYLQAVEDPYCGRASKEVLSTVLNDYDQATTGYYRWQVEYTANELADIIRRRSGIDYGEILALRPLHRGPSGRIDRLEIEGTLRTRVIGKELEIRRTLSESHLYSSAFDVEALDQDERGVPQRWILTGSGWGHGVGLCQIGAAVMAAEGHDYRSILAHYFPGSNLIKLY